MLKLPQRSCKYIKISIGIKRPVGSLKRHKSHQASWDHIYLKPRYYYAWTSFVSCMNAESYTLVLSGHTAPPPLLSSSCLWASMLYPAQPLICGPASAPPAPPGDILCDRCRLLWAPPQSCWPESVFLQCVWETCRHIQFERRSPTLPSGLAATWVTPSPPWLGFISGPLNHKVPPDSALPL